MRPPDASDGMCSAGFDGVPAPRVKLRGGVRGRTGGDATRPLPAVASSRPSRFANDARGVLAADWPVIDRVPQDATGWNGRPGAAL